jgi:chemotaxis protein MotB
LALRGGLRHGSGGGGEMESAGMMRWLLTYADMITLLLALFIILFSISTISKVKLQRLVHDLGGGFNSVDAINNPPNGQTTSATKDNLQAMQNSLQSYIAANNLQNRVQTKIIQDGKRRELVVTLLSDKQLYDSGRADLKDDTKKILDEVYLQVKSRQNQVRVEGNTDNVPIENGEFPSNWELSAARATGVARYFVEHDGLAPNRISALGYGEYRPKFPNDTEAHRAANRRVDVVIMDTDAEMDAENAEAEAAAAESAAAGQSGPAAGGP